MYRNIYTKPEQLNGKTIKTCEVIRTEYGRTAEKYILLAFADGTRHLIGSGSFGFLNPDPPAAGMSQAPGFFSAKEVADKVLRDTRKARRWEKESRERKLAQLKELQRELGMEEAS